MAHLVYDHSPGAYAVRVSCLKCGTMRQLSDMVIDREGPSFRAYYCATTCRPDCCDLSSRVERCQHDGCAKCGGPR